MRKNIYVLLITLIVCVYFSFVPGTVRAQTYGFTVTIEGVSIETKTDGADDKTFTVVIKNNATSSADTIDLEISWLLPDGTNPDPLYQATDVTPQTPYLHTWSVALEPGESKKVKWTVPRTMLTEIGPYVFAIWGWSQGDEDTFELSNTKTIFLKPAVEKPYWVGIKSRHAAPLEIDGADSGLTGDTLLMSEITDDIRYIYYVYNHGTNLDQIHFKISSEFEYIRLSQNPVLVGAKGNARLQLTISYPSFKKGGLFEIAITGVSENDATAAYTHYFYLNIIDDRPPPEEATKPDPTKPDPTKTIEPTQPDLSTYKVVFSEFMFESADGLNGLPQWLEIYNNSPSEINLRGWKVQWKQLKPLPLDVTVTLQEDFIIPSQQCRVIVSKYGRYSGTKYKEKNKLSTDYVYLLPPRLLAGPTADDEEETAAAQEDGPAAQQNIENRLLLIAKGGFSLKLLNAKDELIDQIGTLNGNKQAWKLHKCLIEGVRSSLIRRFDEGVPRSGLVRRGWRRASDAKDLPTGIYYGHWTDLGTPGHRKNMPLPVELSQFSARFIKNEVIINWTTESELNNAGFNIYRSTSRTKNFRPINTKLIQGAGTTGKRTEYKFVDKTAKPNVAYYYRLEDVDFSGKRDISTTYRVRGVIAPTGKHLTTWGTLKVNR